MAPHWATAHPLATWARLQAPSCAAHYSGRSADLPRAPKEGGGQPRDLAEAADAAAFVTQATKTGEMTNWMNNAFESTAARSQCPPSPPPDAASQPPPR